MLITIAGHRFEVNAPPFVAGPFTLTEGQAHSLNQTRVENLRNNFAPKVKEALNGSSELSDSQKAELQAKFDEYAAKYEFGVRQAGQGRTVVDPVEREMLKLAKDDFTKAFFAKHGEKPSKEQVNEYSEKLIDLKGDQYRKRAVAIMKQRESAGEADLAALGLA